MITKIKYFLTCSRKILLKEGLACPSCGNQSSTFVSRKYLVTSLRRCQHCQLLFRSPTTNEKENMMFYQEEYEQGFTTCCPSDDELNKYLLDEFSKSDRDYSKYIEVLFAAGGRKGDHVFDFGCSWGYGSWQLERQGFVVESFEISRNRANYARDKLGISVHDDLSKIDGEFDIFFSSHVLEHVPSVKDAIDFGLSHIKEGGLFVAFTPNGSIEFKQKNISLWNKQWGLVHPNFLDRKFYEQEFLNKKFFLGSSPFPIETIQEWCLNDDSKSHISQLNGDELLVLMKK